MEDVKFKNTVPSQSPPATTLNLLASTIHLAHHKWWHDINTGLPIERNKGELIALMHSELSEALEGVRKSKMDDHLPHLTSEAVELADAIIRIMDYCGAYKIDIDRAVTEKMEYNRRTREDHSHESRRKEGGKKF